MVVLLLGISIGRICLRWIWILYQKSWNQVGCYSMGWGLDWWLSQRFGKIARGSYDFNAVCFAVPSLCKNCNICFHTYLIFVAHHGSCPICPISNLQRISVVVDAFSGCVIALVAFWVATLISVFCPRNWGKLLDFV